MEKKEGGGQGRMHARQNSMGGQQASHARAYHSADAEHTVKARHGGRRERGFHRYSYSLRINGNVVRAGHGSKESQSAEQHDAVRRKRGTGESKTETGRAPRGDGLTAKRVINQPVAGTAITDPTAVPNKQRPSRALVSPSAVWMAGILETQVDTTSP
jgi:hypothetical protein